MKNFTLKSATLLIAMGSMNQVWAADTSLNGLFNLGQDCKVQDNSVQSVQAMLENSKGRVRLAIHARCRKLIECLELQSYDERTGDPDKQNGYDHMNDALGYLIYREFNMIYGRAGARTGIRIY